MDCSKIEIELTLQMYPIAKKKLALLNSLVIPDKHASLIKVDYYSYIEHTVNYWLTFLSEEEMHSAWELFYKKRNDKPLLKWPTCTRSSTQVNE